jgi:hypothetical protein
MDGGEIKRNKRGKKSIKRMNERNNNATSDKNQQQELFTKHGKKIIYSASPGRPEYQI